MSSVTTAIVADIEKQVGAGIARLQAKHDEELKADIARLRQDLESQLSRVTGLAAKVAKVATAETAKAPPAIAATPQTKTPKAKVRKAKGAMKYRDPENPEKMWSGRGTNPRWFKAGIASGKSPEYFAIPGA